MFEAVIITLIQVGLVCALCYIVIWALGKFGIDLPAPVVQIFWAIVALIVILLLYRLLAPMIHVGTFQFVR